MPAFQTSPGTRDILPPHAARWRGFSERFARIVEGAGYQCVIPPMFEDLGVFQRIGEATDIVTKEMYDFEDKGGRHVALRPEQTAGVCRAYAQHRPTPPWKVWYSGPNFRYEKPQAGRYRQFDQVGLEVLGVDDPLLDVEVIALGWRFFTDIGLRGVELSINSLGDAGDRGRYVDVLRGYLKDREGELSPESRVTLGRNPLRVLDSKREEDLPVISGAPLLSDHLSAAARDHFTAVCDGLRLVGVPFTIDPKLVRGLDYYVRTTFEYRSSVLDAAQNAVGGGGRYDGLVEDLGGPPTPGVGLALGVDRTLLACDAEGCFGVPDDVVEVFVVDTTGGLHALGITEALRREGISADRAWDNRSMKAQMKAASRSGAGLAVIIGETEVSESTCTVRNLVSSEQTVVTRSELVQHLIDALGGSDARTHPRRRDT